MKSKILILIIACVSLFATSCSSQMQMQKAKEFSLAPTEVRLDLQMSKFRLLGETTIDVEYRTYLGFIKTVDRVNGEMYDRRNTKSTSFSGKSNLGVSLMLKRAKYKVIEEFPEADYYMPVYTKSDVQKLFLGSSTKVSAKYRAYKYVTDK